NKHESQNHLPALRILAHEIFQENDGSCADERAKQSTDTADDRHEESLDGLRQLHRRWAHEVIEQGVKGASNSGEKAGHGKGEEHVSRRAVTEAAHPAFAVPDSAKRQAKWRMNETPDHQRKHQDSSQSCIVEDS